MGYIKKYEVKVHRKISDGVLIKERPRDSLIHIDKSSNKVLEYTDEVYTTKLISVKKLKQKTVIKTNTLAIKVTDKKINNTWLYDYISIPSNLTPEDLGITEYLLEKGPISNYIYFNRQGNYNFINYKGIDFIIKPCVLINNSIDVEDYISITRKSDHILITINKDSNYNVELLTNKLFYPKLNNNTLEFYECVYKYNKKYIHIYTHSYTMNQRKEVIEYGNNSKRPICMKSQTYFNNGDYYSYTSYNSNLLFLTNNLDVCYFYLKLNPVDPSETLVIKDSPNNYSDLIFLFTLNNKNSVSNIITNPMYTSITSEPIGENVVFNDISLSSSGFNKIQDIPIGKQLYNIDLSTIYNKNKKVLEVNGKDIIDTKPKSYLDVNIYNVLDDNRVQNKFKENLKSFVNKLEQIDKG